MYALYNLLLAVPRLTVTPALRLQRFRAHRERLGVYAPDLVERMRGRKVLWLHNASIGELTASRPLLRRLREELGEWRILLSTTSVTGRDLARELGEADAAVLLPLDFPAAVERALDAIQPSLFAFTETEIWPNLLHALRRRGIPAVLLSGRVSPRSFRRYLWIRPFLRRVLRDVTLFGMQSEAEAERIRALGAPPERVRITGSLKLEAVAEPRALAIEIPGPLWIAASTHAGEEDVCARVFDRLRERFRGLRLLLAPRHLDRLAAVEAVLRAQGLDFVRRTDLRGNRWTGDPPVLLLDTLGELASLYEGAAAAFVGGTLARVGGHNLLEPARAGVPVLYGPHVENVAALADVLASSGGGFRVADEADLAGRLAALLDDPEHRARSGRAAQAVVGSAGSVEASLRAALECLA
ncbi:MAG TPA: glycosyltransferase N-terminal domain-containing protein [Candidatus Binatia bacterium]|nr:glycosyltransferase N-terminal domain-containing protein [Candidatus Binatia bacterium]